MHPEARAEKPSGALHGLRVIDLTRMLAGPFCTQLLADQGADVIKIEEFLGDQSREFGPFRPDDAERLFGGYFASVNRNKRSVVINLREPEGREVLLRLVRDADVVVENFRPGVMDRLGLGYEALHEQNPALVYAAIRGFGDPRTGNSPYMNWPAYDVVAQAMGGIIGITGPDPEHPTKIGPGVGDLVPGAFAAFGIVTAVLRARATGQGQFVDVSMVDSVLAVCERIIHQHSYVGEVPGPEGNQHPILTPFGLFRAKDGHITIAAPSDEWWRQLCRLIGRDDLIDDPRLETQEMRSRNRALVHGLIEEFTRARTKAELMDVFGGKIPFAPVYNVADIFADPHFAHGGMLPEVEQPGSGMPVRLAGVPIRMTATNGGIRRRPPLLGEHTGAVLVEAGLPPAEVENLRQRNIIK